MLRGGIHLETQNCLVGSESKRFLFRYVEMHLKSVWLQVESVKKVFPGLKLGAHVDELRQLLPAILEQIGIQLADWCRKCSLTEKWRC